MVGRTRLSTSEAQDIVTLLNGRGHRVTNLVYVKGHAVVNAIINGTAYVIATQERWADIRKEQRFA